MSKVLCDKCGAEIQGVRDAFVRVIYPTRIVTFHVCRSCGDEVCGTMRVPGCSKP